MTEAAHEVVRLLCEHGLDGLLKAARDKVEALGEPRGSMIVILNEPQARLLAGLLGWHRVQPNTDSRLRLAELDGKLRVSRFGVGLLDVLIAYGGPLETSEQRRQRADDRWHAQLARIADRCPPTARSWVQSLDSDGPCGRRYRRLYRTDPGSAERAALSVARALAELPVRGAELVAVFAARITGDPHAFDFGRAEGRLLLSALETNNGTPPGGLRPREARNFALSMVNLQTDDVSSTVLTANLPGTGHPVIEQMARSGGGWPLPLAELTDLKPAAGRRRRVHVVENPQVFSHLVRGSRFPHPKDRPVLVCTGGFLSAAAERLLRALHCSGWVLSYGGDFDRNGLRIARWLAERYEGLEFWHMDPADYELAAMPGNQPSFSPTDLSWLTSLDGPLADTAHRMAVGGYPAYQEQLVDTLLADLVKDERSNRASKQGQ